jgi:nitrite reductase/ring-hydroxylating ferredoxin subunit
LTGFSDTTACETAVCRLDDIEDPGSKGMTVSSPAGLQDIFIVRRGGDAHGYLNSCPHTGAPLDWTPDRFLDLDGRYIQCAMHGALFRIEDGHCIAGPCNGDRLTRVPVRIEAGVVYVDTASGSDGDGGAPC